MSTFTDWLNSLREEVPEKVLKDVAYMEADLHATTEYLRDTLEQLTTAAGLPLLNEEGKPLRNFQLVDGLLDVIKKVKA